MVQLKKNKPKPAVDMAQRRRLNKRLFLGVGFLMAFCVGIGIGGSDSSDAEATTTGPTPTPTVTVTADPAPAPTVTETAAAAVPAECIDALDKADASLTTAIDTIHTAGDMMGAIQQFDVDALQEGSDDVSKLSEKFDTESLAYLASAATCRAA